MAIDYSSYLSDEQKRSILEQRIQQFAAEAWQHQINAQIAEAAGNTEAVEQANTALATIGDAIAVHETELGKLA